MKIMLLYDNYITNITINIIIANYDIESNKIIIFVI